MTGSTGTSGLLWRKYGMECLEAWPGRHGETQKGSRYGMDDWLTAEKRHGRHGMSTGTAGTTGNASVSKSLSTRQTRRHDSVHVTLLALVCGRWWMLVRLKAARSRYWYAKSSFQGSRVERDKGWS